MAAVYTSDNILNSGATGIAPSTYLGCGYQEATGESITGNAVKKTSEEMTQEAETITSALGANWSVGTAGPVLTIFYEMQ